MIEAITYEDAVAVTPSDSTPDTSGPFAGLYIGVTGDVKVHTLRGSDVVFKNVPQGTTLRVAVSRVWTTGTAATNILGLKQMPWGK